MARYITAFQKGFDAGLREVQLSFMQSDGGLAPVDAFSGHKAILSGPAGGCVLRRSPLPAGTKAFAAFCLSRRALMRARATKHGT